VLQSGINRVVFINSYKDESGINFLKEAKIEVVQIEKPFDAE